MCSKLVIAPRLDLFSVVRNGNHACFGKGQLASLLAGWTPQLCFIIWSPKLLIGVHGKTLDFNQCFRQSHLNTKPQCKAVKFMMENALKTVLAIWRLMKIYRYV